MDSISINPCNVQKNTYVEKLWKNKEYKTPWLWSLVKILTICKNEYPNLMIISNPTGLGSKRGILNRCKNCNLEIGNMIKEFSLSQNIEPLKNYYCDCKFKWEKELQLNEKTYGSPLL